MFIDKANCFHLNDATKTKLKSMKPKFGFNGFGETVYYRTYSRVKSDSTQESWADTVIRVIEGNFTIKKDWHAKHALKWDESYFQDYATKMAESMFEMQWLPPGRGLWACGTDFMYERGSAALNNCGFVSSKHLLDSVTWSMDMLMCGVGIGFDTKWEGEAHFPNKENTYTFVIPDSREGWVDSVRLLLEAYVPQELYFPLYSGGKVDNHDRGNYPIFDYSKIRPKGEPIKGFGGKASGPEPLEKLHHRIDAYLSAYIIYKQFRSSRKVLDILKKLAAYEHNLKASDFDWKHDVNYSAVRCVVDIMNAIGACVVSGNVRRSAEIALGNPSNCTFIDLKNFKKNPERSNIAWMSNNTCIFEKTSDFDYIPQIANSIAINGEPGFCNMLNIRRFGRIGRRNPDPEEYTRELEPDLATGCNPCSEICLESFELCNLSEVFPTRCLSNGKFDEFLFLPAVEFATFYSSNVSLLPTHHSMTNMIIAKNRRIGVSLSGVTDWYSMVEWTNMIKYLRIGYKTVRNINKRLAQETGVPESIRVTTIKPSGSISLLAGVSPGAHYPTFKYAIRRMRVADNSPIHDILIKNGVPHEKDNYSDNTIVFEFPIAHDNPRESKEISMWEQFSLVSTLQREWADNMVSVTIYFNPRTEASQIERALAQYAPNIKSCSLLPHTDEGVYSQSPYEGITEGKYKELLATFKSVDWTQLTGSDGELPRFCTNDICTL